MKRMSFALTTEQVKNKTKTVTRRNGWKNLKKGDFIQPIEKGMGLRKGEKQKLIGEPIQIIDVRFEKLNAITSEDLIKEGFPELSPVEFIAMYCAANKCDEFTIITRIEYKYTKI